LARHQEARVTTRNPRRRSGPSTGGCRGLADLVGVQQRVGDPAGGPEFVGSSGSRAAPHSDAATGAVVAVVVVVDAWPPLGVPVTGGLAVGPPPHAAASTPTSRTPRPRTTALVRRGDRLMVPPRGPPPAGPGYRG
jgi:hypothetical protein